MRSIHEIDKDIEATRLKLVALGIERKQTAMSNAGLVVGTVVLSKRARYIFDSVDAVWTHKLWIKARKILKDGSTGKALVTLYDWEKE